MATRQRVLVIGGGITGTLAALHLVRAGWHVTLAEATHLGAGSSARSAAGIRQQFSTPGTVFAMRHSVAYYRRFAQEVGASVTALVQSGYLFLHDDPAAWRTATEVVAMQHATGLTEVEALAGRALTERFPWVARDGLLGGTWCPTDGFLHPDIVYQEAARAAVAAGATLLQRTPVTGTRHAGGRIVAAQTPRGELEADVFVDATNAWSPRAAAVMGAEVLPITPLKRYLWFLHRTADVAPELFQGLPLVVAPNGAYCRPETRETLLFGKRVAVNAMPNFTDEDQDLVEPRFAHNAGYDAVPYDIWQDLAGAIPFLGDCEGITAATAGFYGATPDHNPFLGFDRQASNLIRAVGFSGHGAMMGPFTAAAVTALADAGRDLPTLSLPEGDVPMAPFQIGRDFAHAEAMVI